MARRNAGQAGSTGSYLKGTPGDPVPAPVQRWQTEVHAHGLYDFEVDTSLLSALEAATAIRLRMESGPPPTAFQQLAQASPQQA